MSQSQNLLDLSSGVVKSKRRIKLVVNKTEYELDVLPKETLLEVLRERLGLTGTKRACENGECGACTCLVNGEPILSCLSLAIEHDGNEIVTIEGLADPVTGKLHPIQEAFIENFGFQCGFCTPGMILSTKALLDKNPNPTENEIHRALAGNLCRCAGYTQIIESAKAAADKLTKAK